MSPDWWVLARQVRPALRYWDAWCPDDGRPLVALDLLDAYGRGRVAATELQRGRELLRGSVGIAWRARTPAAEKAHAVAYMIILLYDMILFPQPPADWDWFVYFGQKVGVIP